MRVFSVVVNTLSSALVMRRAVVRFPAHSIPFLKIPTQMTEERGWVLFQQDRALGHCTKITIAHLNDKAINIQQNSGHVTNQAPLEYIEEAHLQMPSHPLEPG